MSKHLIVASIDAMVYEDLEICKTLPNFKRILDGAAIIKRVTTIYPSVTHPVHGTLITGCTAGKTGAVNNSIFNPENPLMSSSRWYNDLDQLKCETIFHAAKRKGLTTAVSSWPMTNYGVDYIDYLVPCALNSDFEGHDDPIDAYRKLGASEEVAQIISEAVKRFGWENTHPGVEEFQAYCTCEIIKKFKPNLLLTHPSYVDNQRHAGGVWGERVENALKATDIWMGMMLDAIEEAGIMEDTDFVFLSDHGQINITRTVSPNVYLADAGYITANEDGSLISWRAFANSTGASTHVYLKDPDDKELYNGVYKLLSDMANEGIYGFEKVYTTEEVKEKYGLYGDFSFVLETDGYTSFGEWLTRPSVRPCDPSDYRFGHGTHGHEPHKGPQPTFVAKGPSFKAGAVVEVGNILNNAPTLAAALGLEMPEAEGSPVREILV